MSTRGRGGGGFGRGGSSVSAIHHQEASGQNQDTGEQVLLHATHLREQAIDFAARPVIVKVGTPTVTYHVNEKLVTESSPFFAAALKKEWREGLSRKVEIHDVTSDSFNIYMNWLYSRRVPVGEPGGEGDEVRWTRSIDAYALGDLLMDVDFKDAVLDASVVDLCTLQSGTLFVPNPSNKTRIYEKTTSGSKLRELVVYRMAQTDNSALLTEDDPAEFLLDLAKFQLNNRNMQPNILNVFEKAAECGFHEHEPGQCYRAKHAQISTFTM